MCLDPIAKLKTLSWITLGLGVLVSGYLFVSAPATSIITDRQGELARIGAMTNITELKGRASGLAMVADNASKISITLLCFAALVLLFLAVLAGVSIHWLSKYQRDIHRKSPDA